MAIWRRFWVQKWPKLAQNSLKWPQTTPKTVRNDVETFLKKSILGHFGVNFGSILGQFWVHFGSILGHFGSFWVILGHFGSFWVILGRFGSFWVVLGRVGPRKWPSIAQKPKMTPNHPHGPKNGSIHAIMGPKKRLKTVFGDQNNDRKRIFRPWSPYKCC